MLPLKIKFINIPLRRINNQDKTFRIRFDLKLKPLVQSIKQYGLLSPLILRKNKLNTYSIASGFRRYEAAKKNGYKMLNAYILDKGMADQEIFNLILLEFISHTQPNVIEKSIIIKKLNQYYDQDYIISHYFPLLNLSSSRQVYKRIEPLHKLNKDICKAIIDGQLHQNLGLVLSQYRVKDQKYIFQFLSQLNLSISNQFNVVEIITDLSKKEDVTVLEVIDKEDIQAILKENKLNQRQKTELIISYLKEKRAPLLTKAIKGFNRIKKQLHLPPEISFTHPPFFEGPNYKISFQFKNYLELQTRLKTLDKIRYSKEIKQIIP